MTIISFTFKDDPVFLNLSSEEKYKDENGNTVYERHDCKYTNLEYLFDPDQIKALEYNKIPFDIFADYESDPETTYIRWKENRKTTTIVKSSDLNISLLTLKESMKKGNLKALITEREARVYVKPLHQI